MDANFSLKRMAPRKREEGNICTFTDSDYYLANDKVEIYKDEVKSHRKVPDPPAKILTDDNRDPELESSGTDDDNNKADTTEHLGDPPNGSVRANADGSDRQVQSSCGERWKGAVKDEKKKMWSVFMESGIFASACQYGLILWVTDLVCSGELWARLSSKHSTYWQLPSAKYPLTVVGKALNVLDEKFGVGYDIACSFTKTLASSSLGPQFERKHCWCIVNAFHGYSHGYNCQKENHPTVIPGMGLEDLEVMEHIFSASNALGSVTCYMTRYCQC